MKRKNSTTVLEIGQLSEYEKLIQKNKDEKLAFLKSLQIDNVKEDLNESIKKLNAKMPRVYRPKAPLPSRKLYSRMAKVDIDLSEDGIKARVLGKEKKIGLSKTEKLEQRMKKAAELREKKQAKRNKLTYKARINEIFSLVEEACEDFVISWPLFKRKIMDIVGIESSLQANIDVDLLPVSGSPEERLVVETCVLAQDYARNNQRRQLRVTAQDIMLAIENLHQNNNNTGSPKELLH